MTIYRGPGGTGSATSDADTNLYQQFLDEARDARDAALAAQTAAELAETNAETAETNVETAATNASNSASSASSSASAAATSASNASSSAAAAASSASSASTSATNAANSATAAAASATSAANSASTATTQASNASSSATAAASSASSADTSATNAASSASSASTSATNAANSATSASNSASSAATSATNAANSATSASNSASAAAASASEAAGYAASINPTDLVHISGTETITGAKTFSQTITGSITGNAGTVTNGVYTTGDQTIAGTKTFSSNPIVSSGTVNGVAYLNGSKVLTMGSALTFDGTNFVTTGSVTSAGASNSGNLAFTGTGNRITGDFSNATIANRVMFQTSTVNGNTNVGFVPNGSAVQTVLQLHNNADPMNAGIGQLITNTTDISFRSSITGTGTYLPMTFYTGGSERVRIDTSGNVGIGTSSPTYKLDVNGAARIGSTSSTYSEIQISTNSTSFGDLRWSDGSGNIQGYISYKHGDNYLRFATAGTERARIDSSGNLLVGTTFTNPGGISQSGNITTVAPSGKNGINVATIGAGTFIQFANTSFGQTGSITTGGTTTAYNTSSDYRLKENIQPMTGALAKVAALKPVTYKWKADGSDGEGFIAHELQEVVPDCVTGEKDAVDADGNPVYQGIDTSFLVATLTAAIQELKAEFDAYKAAHP